MIAFLAHAGMIRHMIVHVLDILVWAVLQAGQAELAFVVPYRAAVLQRDIPHRADFHADTAFTAVILCEEIYISLGGVKAEDDLLRHRIRGCLLDYSVSHWQRLRRVCGYFFANLSGSLI